MKPACMIAVAILTGALVSACGGAPSPRTLVSCANTVEVTYPAGPGSPVAFFQVQKVITVVDDAAAGATPANGLVAKVYSPVTSVQICDGDCLDGTGGFDTTQEVITNPDGILIYTLGLDPAFPFSGDILETFNATSQCTTSVTVGGVAGP